MAVSNAFIEMLQEMLAPMGHITARRMFGGASLYCDGTLFALIDDDELFLKADTTTQKRYEDEGLKPFTYEGQTGPVSMSYWRAPERLFDDNDAMLDYAREALSVAAAQEAKKRTVKRRAADRKPATRTRRSPSKAGKKPT